MLTSFFCLKLVKFVPAHSACTHYSLWLEHSGPFSPGSLLPFLQIVLAPRKHSGLLSRRGLVLPLSPHSFLHFPHHCPYHFSLCFPHHSSKNSACFPILALTTFASQLITLASTSSITTQTFCLCFPIPGHEHSGLSLSAALSVSPTKVGSP